MDPEARLEVARLFGISRRPIRSQLGGHCCEEQGQRPSGHARLSLEEAGAKGFLFVEAAGHGT